MGQAQDIQFSAADSAEVAAVWQDINHTAEQLFRQVLAQNISKSLQGEIDLGLDDDLGLKPAFSKAQWNLLINPMHIAQQQLEFWQDSSRLWQNTLAGFLGVPQEPIIEPAVDDHRFKHDAWQNKAIYDFIKQAYLLASRCVQRTWALNDGLQEQEAAKVDFFTRQMLDAMSPSNFLATNPMAQDEAIRSGGLSILKGLRNLLSDLEKGDGQLKISMTDLDAFELGKNIASTPGKIVYQTEMMQLIQYSPSTEKVLKRPLLIVPPWINKYYVLDLRPKNSFIRWAVAQGHTVFVISWINPDESYADKGFDDYLNDGTLAAVDAVVRATGEKSINAIGYCLGGTLLAATLAYMAAKRNTRIKSATFFASLTDFACPGELGIFIDEEQLQALEKRMQRGYLDGSEMSTTFNMLRANDLIWSFVINNYLLGKDPFPFDLLYWNSDSTRMPAKMHSFYLRQMYQHNRLSQAGGLKLNNTPIDLTRIRIPSYFLSAGEDHIAPWQSTYAGTQSLQGENRFVLSGSGHIAGVINPPNLEKPKYGYWTNESLPEQGDDWLAGATHHSGSWWPDWQLWVEGLDNNQVEAREPGAGELKVLEDAPGSYAKVRIV